MVVEARRPAMKKTVQRLRSFGEDSQAQMKREIAILIAIILLTVALGFLFVR